MGSLLTSRLHTKPLATENVDALLHRWDVERVDCNVEGDKVADRGHLDGRLENQGNEEEHRNREARPPAANPL